MPPVRAAEMKAEKLSQLSEYEKPKLKSPCERRYSKLFDQHELIPFGTECIVLDDKVTPE